MAPTEKARAFAEYVSIQIPMEEFEALVQSSDDAIPHEKAEGGVYVPFAQYATLIKRGDAGEGGLGLRTPDYRSQSIQTAADRIPFATPEAIDNALRLLGLPEAVWADVDEGDLGQRKAEIIASIAGVDDVAWEEREERMIHLAEKCIERDWSEDDVRDRVSAVKEDLQATSSTPAEKARAFAEYVSIQIPTEEFEALVAAGDDAIPHEKADDGVYVPFAQYATLIKEGLGADDVVPLRTPTKHSQSVGTAAERIPFAGWPNPTAPSDGGEGEGRPVAPLSL